mgnify:CR=1 FL=1
MKKIYNIDGEIWSFNEQLGTFEQIAPPPALDGGIISTGACFVLAAGLIMLAVSWLLV